MARGRRPQLPHAVVAQLQGSPQARQRLELVLETLAGDKGWPAATAAAGLGRTRFGKLRRRALQAALEALEPKAAGRPPEAATPEARQIAQLQQEVQALQTALRAAQIREEVALLMPHLLQEKRRKKTGGGAVKKKRRNLPSGRPARPSPAAVTGTPRRSGRSRSG